MRAALALVVLVGCGPAVGVGDDGTDGGGGSGGQHGSSSGGESGDAPAECSVALEHGAVNRAQVASSLAAVLCIAQEACCVDTRPSDSCRHARNMDFERPYTYGFGCSSSEVSVGDRCETAAPNVCVGLEG